MNLIFSDRLYSITELSQIAGLVDATLWSRLKHAGIKKDEYARYLGADILAAEARGYNLFRPPAPMGKGLQAAHTVRTAIAKERRKPKEELVLPNKSLINPNRKYTNAELAQIAGINHDTMWYRLKHTKILLDSEKRYLGADILAAEAEGFDLFQPVKTKTPTKTPKAPTKETTQPVHNLTDTLALADKIRKIIAESKVPNKDIHDVLKFVAGTLK
jgi:hypothetical protein